MFPTNLSRSIDVYCHFELFCDLRVVAPINRLIILHRDCISTEECQNRSELTKCEAGQCVHKDVRPFVALDGVALLCMFVAGSVAAGGGLGGGGIFVPMLILILAFSARDAGILRF